MSYLDLAEIDLEHEIRLSRLTHDEVSLLKENSRGVIDFNTFLLHRLKEISHYEVLTPVSYNSPIALGLSQGGLGAVYGTICRYLMLLTHHQSCDVFKGYDSTKTSQYMASITEPTKAHTVIFFVPREVFCGESYYTAAEIDWTLNNYNLMTNIQYVFGAYNTTNIALLSQTLFGLRVQGNRQSKVI